MYILDHAVAPWFLEVTPNLKRSFYFLLPQNLPWHPAAPPAAKSNSLSQLFLPADDTHTHTHLTSERPSCTSEETLQSTVLCCFGCKQTGRYLLSKSLRPNLPDPHSPSGNWKHKPRCFTAYIKVTRATNINTEC